MSKRPAQVSLKTIDPKEMKNEMKLEKDWQCVECKAIFSTKGNLVAHAKSMHGCEIFDAVECPECKGLYKYMKNFLVHFLKAHKSLGLNEAEKNINLIPATYEGNFFLMSQKQCVKNVFQT